MSNWQDPSAVVIGEREHDRIFSTDIQSISDVGDIQKMMAIDTISYLPDDILVKVDRAAMGVSLETRVPFLDHHIFEFVSKIPLTMKLKHGVGKSILRDVLFRYVPKELIERPKMGFGIPIHDWIRSDLRNWAEQMLFDCSKTDIYLPTDLIRKKWDDHLDNKNNNFYELWSVIQLNQWMANQN